MSYLTMLADDEASDYDIKELANLMLESGDYQDNLEYSHTMDTDMWDITTVLVSQADLDEGASSNA